MIAALVVAAAIPFVTFIGLWLGGAVILTKHELDH